MNNLKVLYIVAFITFVVSAAKDTTDLRRQIEALQQSISSVYTIINQFAQESQADISKCKTQYDESRTEINNQKAHLKNFTCIVCESKITSFSDYDYNGAMNSVISSDYKEREKISASIKMQLEEFWENLNSIKSELKKCNTDVKCIEDIYGKFNSTRAEIVVGLNRMKQTLQKADAKQSQTIVNKIIQQIKTRADDAIDCVSKLSDSKQKVDSLEIVPTLVSNASQKIMQMYNSSHDFSSKVSGEFSKYIEEETKKIAEETDDHEREAENKNDNIESSVKILPELQKIKESYLKMFNMRISEYERDLFDVANENIQQLNQDLPDLKALLTALQKCSEINCIENSGRNAESELKRIKGNIDQKLHAAVDKTEQIKEKITSMKTNAQNTFEKEISAAKDAINLEKQIEELQQSVSSVSTTIAQFEQESQADISGCKTQYDESQAEINKQKAHLKNFTCIVCESRITSFSGDDYNGAINSAISTDKKKRGEISAPIKVQLEKFRSNLNDIKTKLEKCNTGAKCIEDIYDEFNSTRAKILVDLKTINGTLQTADAKLSQTIEKAVNETIHEIETRADDAIECVLKLTDSKQKIDSLEIVPTLVSNASQKIRQTYTSSHDFSSKASGEFSKHIEEETKRAAKEVDDHEKEAENKNDNLDSCVKNLLELGKIKESSLEKFNERISEYEKILSDVTNESIKKINQDFPNLGAFLTELQECSEINCIKAIGSNADSRLEKIKENIDEACNTTIEKSKQIKTEITSMKTDVENKFKRELDGIVSSVLDCLNYRTAEKKVLSEKLETWRLLLENTTNSLNKKENKTTDDFNSYINDNRMISNCIRMYRAINKAEEGLRNFSRKACIDLAKVYKRDYSEFLEKGNNYSLTYKNLFDNGRSQIGQKVTQIKEIKDALNRCKLESCLKEANASMNAFDNLESDLNFLLDDTEEQNANLRNISYPSLNNFAVEISPRGKKAKICLSKLSDTRKIFSKNDERLNKTFKLVEKHLNEQTNNTKRFMNKMSGSIDQHLTAEINSIENRIEIHKKKAVYFRVNITACEEAKSQLYSARDGFSNLFQDVASDFVKSLLTYSNQTLEYIEKYKADSMLTNLSLCPDEVCIDSLLNESEDASKDIETQLKIYDEKIQKLKGDITVKKETIEEDYSGSVDKIYKEMTECIDNLWISKSRLSGDMKNVTADFTKVIEDLHRIKRSADRGLDDYKKNNISAVHSAYKQNMSRIESAEAKLQNFKYKVCKDSISAFKVDNYAKLLDKIFSDYERAYEKLIEEPENSSKDAVTRLKEVNTNLAKCQDNDNECLFNVFAQYESYLEKDLNNITRDVSETIETLRYHVLHNVTQITERLSIGSDQAVRCIQKLATVKGTLDKTQTSLISVLKNLTSLVGEAFILAENETENFQNQLQESLANLTSQIKDEEALAAKKKINVSSCYSNETPENNKNEYIEQFSEEVENCTSDLNRTGLSYSEKIEEYTATISTAYKELGECTQETCMDPIFQRAEKIKNEQIIDVEPALIRKINNFSLVMRAKSVEIIHNFEKEVTPLTSDILKCIKSDIANSSTLPEISFIIIMVLMMIQLNFNVC